MGVVLVDGVLHTGLRVLNLILTAFYVSCHYRIINDGVTTMVILMTCELCEQKALFFFSSFSPIRKMLKFLEKKKTDVN